MNTNIINKKYKYKKAYIQTPQQPPLNKLPCKTGESAKKQQHMQYISKKRNINGELYLYLH